MNVSKSLISTGVAHMIYDILIREAGLDPSLYVMRDSFVFWFNDEGTREFRFCGSLGVGGKFWKTNQRWYVNCYKEQETPNRLETIKKTNEALAKLLLEIRWYEES